MFGRDDFLNMTFVSSPSVVQRARSSDTSVLTAADAVAMIYRWTGEVLGCRVRVSLATRPCG